MRFSILAIVASAAFVAAQDLSQLPACAIPCFLPAVQGSGCGLSDVKCQCTTGRDSITNSVAGCVPNRCSASDIAAISTVVSKLCASAGVTISDLPSVAPSSGATPAATSAVNGTASRSQSRTATASAAPAASTAAAPVNIMNIGAVAMGLAAFAL